MPPTIKLGKAFVPPLPALALTPPQSPRSVSCAMNERPRKPPHLSEQGRAERETRRVRLAEALRENLKRRKAQSRDRAAAVSDGGSGGESGGEPGGEA